MIFAFNFTCSSDQALSDLMVKTLIKYCSPNLANIRVVQTGGRQYTSYGNGAGFEASMMKLNELSYICESFNVRADDYILSVDSDVIFTSQQVFDYVDGTYGLIGVQHQQPYNTALGLFGHMSGALIFIRGDIAHRIANLTDDELGKIRQEHFVRFNLTENEDIVLSYIAKLCGANELDLPNELTSGNLQEDFNSNKLRSFYHLNFNPETFLGEPCGKKQNIPGIFESKGIEL